ncbi:MAG: FUN14 domain-containing protein [Candidatus Nezhaarchaeota archaeon]|nr:FUN14 domain-containing protein [Candidatus Nezhaarchaeota archaeon]MCX8141950.1 FUN14 domain-containing protein [Candidatus Nezhaarchaeota archaeon]MDW8050269.1 hypothetical protein [Nitrososphaerota archaeon]
MSVPPEIAWIIPILVPFFIGLFIGMIIKRALKLALAVIALIMVLIIFGYITIPGIEKIIEKTITFLPKIQSELGPLINVIPYSSATFLIGLVIGLWKG